MNLTQTLNELLKNLSQAVKQGSEKVIYSFADIEQWQIGVLPILLDYKLIKPISAAQSMICQGCENNCFMDIDPYKAKGKTRYFIVCDDSEKQPYMGRMTIPPEQLQQWQCSIKNVALLLAELLDFSDISFDENTSTQKTIALGMLKSSNGRKDVSLHKQPLSLGLNQIQMPINELLFIEDGKIIIDRPRIDAVLALKQPIQAKDYQSNTDKLVVRKATTQAMYQDWQGAYEQLKIDNPIKPEQPKRSKKWHAYQISKMDIAQGKSVETIKRSLKN